MTTSEEVYIPIISCGYDFPKFADVDKLMQEAIEWGKRFELIGDDYDPSDNFCYYAPEVPILEYNVRLLFSKVSLFVFATDDLCDNISSNANVERISNLCDLFLRCVEQDNIDYKTEIQQSNDNYERALLDLAREWNVFPCAIKRRSFLRELTYYFEVMKKERKASKKKKVMPLFEYDLCRYYSSGANVAQSILCFMMDIDFPLELKSTQWSFLFFASANKINTMYNDMASFEKEIKEESLSSIIPVLKKHRNYEKWQPAIDDAVQILLDELKNFELLSKLLPDDRVLYLVKIAPRTFKWVMDQSYQSRRYNFRSRFVIENKQPAELTDAMSATTSQSG